MRYGAGSLAIAARRAGPRTILERVRYEGISRCSRAFRSGNAALVVLSQLGPGVVRGDSVTTRGHLHGGAHLIVTNQAATRLMGGARESRSEAVWMLDEDAVLELLGEPLVATSSARYEGSTTVELGSRSFILVSELACVPPGAQVCLRTLVRRAGHELHYDAFEAAAVAPHTVGTLTVVGLTEDRIAPVVAALDRCADALGDASIADGALTSGALGRVLGDASIGVGALPSGVLARVLGMDIWTVRSILAALREAAWTALMTPQQR